MHEQADRAEMSITIYSRDPSFKVAPLAETLQSCSVGGWLCADLFKNFLQECPQQLGTIRLRLYRHRFFSATKAAEGSPSETALKVAHRAAHAAVHSAGCTAHRATARNTAVFKNDVIRSSRKVNQFQRLECGIS